LKITYQIGGKHKALSLNPSTTTTTTTKKKKKKKKEKEITYEALITNARMLGTGNMVVTMYDLHSLFSQGT
jgi:hypothetical protein